MEFETTSIDRVIETLQRGNPGIDARAVRTAYQYAATAHEGQKRKSGEPYIVHPLAAAQILAELNMDAATIQAALLHDVVEDVKGITLKDIERKFGKEVAGLVDGVTKLGNIEVESRGEQQAEYIRKMFIAMARDVRVILIKLADRLHNMRTLGALSHERQLDNARETLDIFAPLAHRFGISQIKWELEDLSFSYLYPEKYDQVARMVRESRAAREAYGDRVMNEIASELDRVGITAHIAGRPKHLYSIYQKMINRGKDFSEIYDLIALRIIVDSVKDVYGALGTVHNLYKPMPGRFKDYVAMPKFNMYQSLHTTVIGPSGRPLEIQIRTEEMHRRAEYGVAAHWRYKEGGVPDDLDERLAWLRQILEWQTETKDPEEFMDALKIDLFEEEVFVFTPKGDVRSLKRGSTPIDFAYQIHTEIGHKTVGAKVNGSIVPLAYQLETGDRVEILTNKNATPSRDWLEIVATSSARQKIRSFLAKTTRDSDVARGHDEFAKVMRKHGVSLSNRKVAHALDQVAVDMHFTDAADLYCQIGSSKLSARLVGTRLLKQLSKLGVIDDAKLAAAGLGIPGGVGASAGPAHATPDTDGFDPDVPMLAPRSARRPKPTGGGVVVKGIDDVLVRLSKCCNPVPGDEIIGFVTRGRGVSVHRATCPNAKELLESPERLIEVDWDRGAHATYHVEVFIQALDRLRLLQDVTMRVAESGVNILSSSTTTHKDGIVDMRFLFETGEMSNLDALLASLRAVEGVFMARRMLPGEGQKKKVKAKAK
jgi:GTP pyrophosphokinase